MLFLWFFHACRRSSPRFLMVSDHVNYLTFEDPGAVNTVRRALKLAHAGDLYGAAETAGVDVAHAAVVSEGLRKGMRYSIGAEIDNDPRARPDAQNIVDAMRPDGMIRSVKFLTIDHPEKGGEYAWPFDNPEFAHFYDAVGTDRVWELYMARLLDDVEKLPGHIVGNFYRPAKFGHWPDEAKLEEYEDRLLDLVLARGMAVEIYTRPFYRDLPEEQRRRFIDANTRLIRKAKEKNVPIAIGSGAHSPKDQGGAFDVVLRMLDECDVNEIVFPVGGRLARVALRATKEHIEKQQKIQEPAQPGSSITGLSRAELGLPEEPERTPEELAATPKSGRDSGPKKRASSPARATKKPEPQEAPSKSSSRRSAESAASSAKAKENAAQAQEPAEEPAATDLSMEKPPAKAKSATSKAAAKAPAVKPVNNAKPAVKEKAPPPKPAAKTDAKKTTVVKAPAKKAAASKTAAAKPAAKKLASKPAVKPAAKKPAVKKAAAATKKAPAKKTAPKVAPKAKKVAPKNGAKKPAAKKTATATRSVKKTSKPSSTKGTTTKKKSTTKRR